MAGILGTLTQQQQLELIYVGYFNRAADTGGFAFWEGQNVSAQAQGQSAAVALTNIANSFTPQAETLALYPFLATTTKLDPNSSVDQAAVTNLVNSIYQNLFGHGLAAGDTYWTNQILTGKTSLGAAVLSIANGATGADATILENKITVATNFTQQTALAGLGNGTPTAAYLLAAHTVLAGVDGTSLNDASVVAAEAATTAFVNQNVPVSQTYTLTTGVDHISATTANVVVNGTLGANATLSPLDVISGASGINTLNLTDLTGGSILPTSATITNIQVLNDTSVGSVGNASAGAVFDTTAVTGLTNLNVTSFSGNNVNQADDIKASATTAVVVNDQLTSSLGQSMIVTGGSTVAITEANGAFFNNEIAVYGGAGTTSVSIKQTEAATVTGHDAYVLVQDTNYGSATKAGVIATVTLDGLSNGATLDSSALTNLTINNVDAFQSVAINNGGFTTGATALNLSLNNDAAFTLVDNSGTSAYTSLNVVTGAAASTIQENGFSKVAAETISGASVLTQTASNLTALKTITVSGAAGLIDTDLASIGALTSVTDTSSGPVTVTLDDTKASFSGASATGAEVVTISSDATKAITGNGLAASEVVFNNNASTFTTANSGANVTGFKVLGVGANGAGTFNMAASPFNGFTSIDDQGVTAGAVSFTNVAAGTALAIDAASPGVVTYQTADATGVTDSVAVTLGEAAGNANGLAATTTGFQATSNLVLRDSALVGIGNVNVTVNDTSTNAGSNGIAVGALSDSSLSNLKISGTGDLVVQSTYIDSLASLSLTDNSTGVTGLTFNNGITDNSLTSLTVAGSNTAAAGMALGTLNDTATSLTMTDSYVGPVSLTLNDTGTFTTESYTNSSAKGVLTLGNNSGAALSSLTLSGAVVDTVTSDAVTKGITVSGATDNSYVQFDTTNSGGAGVTATPGTYYSDSITLGNGVGDYVYDAGIGNISVTLGNGAGDIVYVDYNSTNTTSTQTVVVGSGAGDYIYTGWNSGVSGGTVNITTGDLATGGDTIYAASSNVHATVSVGAGNNSIYIDGNSDTIGVTGGNGNNYVEAFGTNDTINVTLGNGANTVDTTSTGATVNIAVGTGANNVYLGLGASGSVTFGAHTGVDTIAVGANNSVNLAKIVTITGLNSSATTNDTIHFGGDASSATGAVFNANPDLANYLSGHNLTATLANDIVAVFSDTNLAQHHVGEFTFGGQTYLVEQANAAGSAFAANDTVVALVGTTVTASSSVAAGFLTLHG